MRILAIADLFVPAPVMEEALASLGPSRLDVVEWATRDEAELHHHVRQIERFGPGACAPPAAVWAPARDAELIVTHMCPVSAELIAHAAALRMIGVCRAGVENIDVAAANTRHVRLYQVPGRNAVAVAEFTVGLILAERRNIARAHASLSAGGWRKNFSNDGQYTELTGKAVGLVGFGSIGQLVAARLLPFGVRLGVHDPLQRPDMIGRHGGRSMGLAELLGWADVVSLHARRGPHELPLIGAAELALMKPTAILVNTARAHLVDAAALVEALERGAIAGAAIDVYEQEPLPADAPLRRLDNVTLTPHLAGSTVEAFHQSPRLLADAIRKDLERA